MKKVKFLVASAVVMSFLFMSFFMARPVTISAAEPAKVKSEIGKCYIVSIRGKSLAGGTTTPATTQSEVTAEPPSIRVPQGGCVVWVNWANRPEISISFEEGKICEDATESPVSFRLVPGSGCYVTDYLAMGETSSLRFMQAGTYKYELFVQGRTAPVARGEVIVHK